LDAVVDVAFTVDLAANSPSLRRQVMHALAILCDRKFQESNWVRHEPGILGLESSLDDVVGDLFDSLRVLPDPDHLVGMSLVPGDDLDALRDLGASLTLVIDRHSVYDEAGCVRDREWADVVDAATRALASMVRAWGFAIEARSPLGGETPGSG